MIKIEQPQLVCDENESRLETYVTIDNIRERIWFSVDKKYESYLCYERSDAYVIAILDYAMRNGHDISCEAPITEELYYNLDKVLIDAIVGYNKHFYRIKIDAPITNEDLICAGAVGTGISCGVDSLHAMANQTNLKYKNHNITHLTFNNVGSHGEAERAQILYQQRLARPKKFAEEYGYNFVASNSNLMDIIKQSHFKTHTFSSMFAVFCLQKLYSVYYYASGGYHYDEFSLCDNPKSSSGSYEILSLPLFSTKKLRIYSEGAGLSRMDKLKLVVNYSPSYKYLNVCLKEGENCGKCEKCIRTLLGIDLYRKLDKYEHVFDIQYYKNNKKWYILQMLIQIADKKHDYYEMYPHFKDEISLEMKIKVLPYKLRNIFPASFKTSIIGKFFKSFLE